MARASWQFIATLGLAATLASASGCKDRNTTGELTAPGDATEFEGKHTKAFDDDYTDATVQLSGRAPNDVLDQQLFAARLGFADVLAVVKVEQVFGKGRYEGRKEQFVSISIEEVLMGTLPKGTEPGQLLVVKGEDDLPSDLHDQTLLLFIKWAPGDAPSYHHHLMPAEGELLTYIGAMVKHAQGEGVLDQDGEVSKRPRRKSRKDRKKRGEKKDPAAVEDDDPPV